jgi:hypothetical protein
LTIYSTIPYDELSTDSCFLSKNGNWKYLISSCQSFPRATLINSTLIKKLLEIFTVNVLVVVGNQVLKQFVGILMGMNCAPVLAVFSIFIQGETYEGSPYTLVHNDI